jgi:hypothetical protein
VDYYFVRRSVGPGKLGDNNLLHVLKPLVSFLPPELLGLIPALFALGTHLALRAGLRPVVLVAFSHSTILITA